MLYDAVCNIIIFLVRNSKLLHVLRSNIVSDSILNGIQNGIMRPLGNIFEPCGLLSPIEYNSFISKFLHFYILYYLLSIPLPYYNTL